VIAHILTNRPHIQTKKNFSLLALDFWQFLCYIAKKEDGMETTLDRFGRIIIPKKVRSNLGLKPGAHLTIEETDDTIVLKPVSDEPHVIDKDGVLVFSGAATGNIEETLAQHRKERLKTIGGKCEDSV